VNILADEPAAPKGNLVARNISVGGRWYGVQNEAKPYVTFTDNSVDQEDVFQGTPPETFRLRDDAPVYELGFKPIPVEKSGLCEDEYRTGVCEIFFWREVNPLFIVTYEPYIEGD
jgi:hypothetical protein